MKLKCNSCAGVYADTCDDGLDYYHACAKIEVSEGIYIDRPDKRDENVGKLVAGKGVSMVIDIEI